MEKKEFYINCDGINCHAKLDFPKEEKDKYPLLVIIHGLTGHMEERHIVATAETANQVGYATLRVELYGHGKSDGNFCDHTILLWMAEAMRVIEYAKSLDFVTNIYLAGHSQGGLTTVLTGGTMGDCIKAMIPMSPATSIKDYALSGDFLGAHFDPDNLPETLHLHDEFYLKPGYIRAARLLPIEECIKRFSKPVLIIHGTKDEAIPFSYAEKLVSEYSNAKLAVIPDDTHCYDYHLDLVLDAVASFLKEQEQLF